MHLVYRYMLSITHTSNLQAYLWQLEVWTPALEGITYNSSIIVI